VNCLKRGIGLRTLQYLLGHDRITTTEIYMNISPEDAIREFQAKW
jgi:integrase/recombinase XerD